MVGHDLLGTTLPYSYQYNDFSKYGVIGEVVEKVIRFEPFLIVLALWPKHFSVPNLISKSAERRLNAREQNRSTHRQA